MPPDASELLEAWRGAEAAYTDMASHFLSPEPGSHVLDKESLIALTHLRLAADSRRASYFGACEAIRGKHPHAATQSRD